MGKIKTKWEKASKTERKQKRKQKKKKNENKKRKQKKKKARKGNHWKGTKTSFLARRKLVRPWKREKERRREGESRVQFIMRDRSSMTSVEF